LSIKLKVSLVKHTKIFKYKTPISLEKPEFQTHKVQGEPL